MPVLLSRHRRTRDARRPGACARTIAAVLRGQPTRPFDFTALGTMASLGARRGVAWLPHTIILTGFVACFLWRTYYFLCLPGLDRKVRVALDWTLDLLFPRGIAELRVYTESSCERSAQDDGLAVRLQIARADVPECFRTVDSGFGAPILASAGEAFDRDDL